MTLSKKPTFIAATGPLVLLRGYDWLCRCGESNYEDYRECLMCDGLRRDTEINYRTVAYNDENEDEVPFWP
jgi:CDGSH-type Zn-finger protein